MYNQKRPSSSSAGKGGIGGLSLFDPGIVPTHKWWRIREHPVCCLCQTYNVIAKLKSDPSLIPESRISIKTVILVFSDRLMVLFSLN